MIYKIINDLIMIIKLYHRTLKEYSLDMCLMAYSCQTYIQKNLQITDQIYNVISYFP